MKADERFLFIDIETTGLDAGHEHMLEFGAMLTDVNLRVLDTFSDTVWSDPTALRVNQLDRNAMLGSEDAKFIMNMHAANGLLKEAELYGHHHEHVEMLFLEWMAKHDLGIGDPVCGSSVHFDRTFMDRFMHEANVKLSYRNIDVSTLKELYVRWGIADGTELMKPVGRKQHRVMPDLEDSIEELKWYQCMLLETRKLELS